MSKRLSTVLMILILTLALLADAVVRGDIEESGAILALAMVSGILIVITRSVFMRKPNLHSPYLYYAALSFSGASGVFVYTILTPSPVLSLWSMTTKLLFSIIASVSIVLPTFLLAKLMKVGTVPWERNIGGGPQ